MRSAVTVVSLLSLLLVSAAPRKLLEDATAAAEEHQRILAELEEVHQLRERMLQAAGQYSTASRYTGEAPAPSIAQPYTGSSNAGTSVARGGTNSGFSTGGDDPAGGSNMGSSAGGGTSSGTTPATSSSSGST